MRKLLLLALLAALALPARGETTRFWRQASTADFEKGTAKGVSLRSDGELLLAPRFTPLADPNLEFLWAIAEDSNGTVYVGGGSPARVVQIDPAGQTKVVFESQALEVHALAIDPKTGTLFIATSPDGSVYQLPRGGEARVLFEPRTKYLWDLVCHPNGTLYLATGDKGEIFRIAPDGKGELFFSSGETHVRALALDAAGNLYAGTEPNGLVLRVSPKGEAFVLHEMPRREVTALRFDAAGRLYAAAIGQKAAAPSVPGAPPSFTPPPTPQATAPVPAAVVTGGAPGGRLPFAPGGGSDIYRIAADGFPESVWSSENHLVYALAFDPQGRLLAGTGNQGRVFAVDSPTLFTYLVQCQSEQVTTLVASRSGRLYLGTANPGKVFAVGPELELEGSFESSVFDAALFSLWGRISWQSRSNASATTVHLFTRSGNTSDAQKNWSAWSPAYTDPAGTEIASPSARFLQWKAVLRAADSRTPSLSAISVAYLRRNVAPTVETVVVQAPGISIRSLPSGGSQPEPAELELPPPPARQSSGAPPVPPPSPASRVEPPPQGTAERGVRSVLWSASDENNDDLLYAVYYRGEGETRWKLMKENLKEKFYTWDAATLPDGAYRIRVVASDAPSNPADRALRGENSSDRFEVDNTPPRIDALAAVAKSPTVEMSFTAADTYSPLKRAEYSLDASEWKSIFPASGTTDAREHRYNFRLEKLEPGEHTVIIRIYDQFDNPALAKTTFTVP